MCALYSVERKKNSHRSVGTFYTYYCHKSKHSAHDETCIKHLLLLPLHFCRSTCISTCPEMHLIGVRAYVRGTHRLRGDHCKWREEFRPLSAPKAHMQRRDGSPGTSCNLEKRNADHMYMTMMKGGGKVGVRLGDCYPYASYGPSGIKLLDLSFGSFATCFCFFFVGYSRTSSFQSADLLRLLYWSRGREKNSNRRLTRSHQGIAPRLLIRRLPINS